MKKEQPHPKVFHLKFETQEDLANTFMRFQEHYESPKFRARAFSFEEFKAWYIKEYGEFSYVEDWSGFNIPGYILQAFRDGDFDPLTDLEKKLLEAFKDEEDDKFYIIGTLTESDSLEHEMRHAAYYVCRTYRIRCIEIIDENADSEDVKIMIEWLTKKGYHEAVIYDEIQAYLGADSEWLINEEGLKLTDLLPKAFNAVYSELILNS